MVRKACPIMRRKIIPLILFLSMVPANASYAWHGTVSLKALNLDMPQIFNENLGCNLNALESNAIRIYLKPLSPVSCSIEDFLSSQRKALKSA